MPPKKVQDIERPKRVLGIDPLSRGVGFAVLEGPDCLVDWGVKTTGTADNRKAIRVIEALIARFRPDVLAIEDWESSESRRCDRVQKLLSRIASGGKQRVRVRLITHRQVLTVGPRSEVNTKYERSRYIAKRFPELQAFVPPFRKPWMNEDSRMSIFDATLFALAAFRVEPIMLQLPAQGETSATE